MGESVVLWAGKALSGEEEERTRRMVALLERTGSAGRGGGPRPLPARIRAWVDPRRARARGPRGAVARDRRGPED